MKVGKYTGVAKGIAGVVALAALVGCSSDTGKGTVVSIMDPYAVGCQVTAGLGQTAQAADEVNSPGRYVFDPAPLVAVPVTATGCTDAASGIALPTLSAPADSSVVTPITTIVNAMMAADPTLTAGAASLAVATSLGLPTGTDLLNYDPLEAAVTDAATALKIQAASNQLTSMIILIESVSGAGDSSAVVKAIAAAVAGSAAGGAGATVDLTNAVTLKSIARNAGAEEGHAESIANAASAVNAQIKQAADSYTGGDPMGLLKTMTAATIVASNLGAEIEAAFESDGYLYAPVDTLSQNVVTNVGTLVTAAEAEVDESGMSSDVVVIGDDNPTDQTGSTGSSS
jgi:hypothetical protein